MIWLLLLGCPAPDDTGGIGPGVYTVRHWTEPAPPVAGEEAELWLQVMGPDGQPVEDVQQTHERLVHSFLVPSDLSVFAHLHHEDFGAITADDLRDATFHFPYAFPVAGEWVVAFDFAHRNVARATSGRLTVEGSPAQADAPEVALSDVSDLGAVRGELVWEVAPRAGVEARWTLHLTDGGAPVTDLVPYLGADAHAAMFASDLAAMGHGHAWVEGMASMPPGHVMPHLYDGPDVPFRHVFPVAGPWRLWIQVQRPAGVLTLPFWIDVG